MFNYWFWTRKEPEVKSSWEILQLWMNYTVELLQDLKPIWTINVNLTWAVLFVGFLWIWIKLYIISKGLKKIEKEILENMKELMSNNSTARHSEIAKYDSKYSESIKVYFMKVPIGFNCKKFNSPIVDLRRLRRFQLLRTASWVKEVNRLSENSFNHLEILNKDTLQNTFDIDLTEFITNPIHNLGYLCSEKYKNYFEQFKLSEIILQRSKIELGVYGEYVVSTKIAWRANNKALRNVITKNGKVKKVLRKPGSLLYRNGFEGCYEYGKSTILRKIIRTNLENSIAKLKSQCSKQTSRLNKNMKMIEKYGLPENEQCDESMEIIDKYGLSENEQCDENMEIIDKYGLSENEQYESQSYSGTSQISSSNTYSLDHPKKPIKEPKMNKSAKLRIRHNMQLCKNLQIASWRKKGFDPPAPDSPIYVPKI